MIAIAANAFKRESIFRDYQDHENFCNLIEHRLLGSRIVIIQSRAKQNDEIDSVISEIGLTLGKQRNIKEWQASTKTRLFNWIKKPLDVSFSAVFQGYFDVSKQNINEVNLLTIVQSHG